LRRELRGQVEFSYIVQDALEDAFFFGRRIPSRRTSSDEVTDCDALAAMFRRKRNGILSHSIRRKGRKPTDGEPAHVRPSFRYNTAISQSHRGCSMKNVYLFALGIVATLLLLRGNVEARAAGCDAIGNVRFICDQLGPEDLAPVPGSEWVL